MGAPEAFTATGSLVHTLAEAVPGECTGMGSAFTKKTAVMTPPA